MNMNWQCGSNEAHHKLEGEAQIDLNVNLRSTRRLTGGYSLKLAAQGRQNMTKKKRSR